jgi:pimeloyl-ACP methyl ester carboxylesterase
MSEGLPIVLIPGLLCSARLYLSQIPELRKLGAVTVADHTRADSFPEIARGILSEAPERFRLAGFSMGGYLAFEIARQAPGCIAKLALIDTSARADTPEATERRKRLMQIAQRDGLRAVNDVLFPLLVHETRKQDQELRALIDTMAEEVGVAAFLRQQTALIARPDSRADLPSINYPTLVIVGEADQVTPVNLAQEMADLIPDARLEVIANSGHLSPLEQPEEMTKLLVDWFGS